MKGLTVPSYMIPDGYAANVEFIAAVPQISEVELLFFMWDDETERLFRAESPAIRPYADTLDFSVHLPDSLLPEHEIILDFTAGWCRRYVIHPPAEVPDVFIELVNGWREKYGEIFCFENLIGRDFLSLLPAMPGIPLCIDIGHLLINGLDPAEFIKGLENPVREIHLHGLQDGRDHKPFTAEAAWFRRLTPWLKKYEGAVNLEVFHYNDARAISESLATAGLIDSPLPVRDVPPPWKEA